MTNFNIDTSYFSNMAKSISEVAKNIMPPKINYSFLTEETKKLSTIADKLKHPTLEVNVPHEYAKELIGEDESNINEISENNILLDLIKYTQRVEQNQEEYIKSSAKEIRIDRIISIISVLVALAALIYSIIK